MIEKGGDYAFPEFTGGDRGWVLCPEYSGDHPVEISPPGWATRIFLFGAALLPDIEFRREVVEPTSVLRDEASERNVTRPATNQGDTEEQAEGAPGTLEGKTEPPSHELVTLGSDVLTGHDVHWSISIKGNPHLLIAGLPGMGKTTCILNICKQMLSVGIRPIVFSYHEDIDEKLEQAVGRVRLVDYHGLGFNPLHVIDRESRMSYLDVAGSLRAHFLLDLPGVGRSSVGAHPQGNQG